MTAQGIPATYQLWRDHRGRVSLLRVVTLACLLWPAVLTAWEVPGQADVPERDRVFESSWSVDPRAVRDAARVCARVAVSAGDPDAASLVEALADDPLRGALDVTATNALFNRVVAYVDRRA